MNKLLKRINASSYQYSYRYLVIKYQKTSLLFIHECIPFGELGKVFCIFYYKWICM